MRFVKEEKRILEINSIELTMLRRIMVRFRIKAMEQGKPTEDIDKLILKVVRA